MFNLSNNETHCYTIYAAIFKGSLKNMYLSLKSLQILSKDNASLSHFKGIIKYNTRAECFDSTNLYCFISFFFLVCFFRVGSTPY